MYILLGVTKEFSRQRMKNVVVHGILQGCVALEQDVCVNVVGSLNNLLNEENSLFRMQDYKVW